MSLDDTNLSTDELDVTPKPQPLDVVSSDTALAEAPVGDDELGSQLALKNLERRRKEKRRKRRIKIIAACVVVGGVLAATVGRSLFRPAETEPEYVPETAVVERRAFQNIISSSGALKAGSTVAVTPEVDGTIESVLVKEGDKVKKGDLLFTIKNDSLDKAVNDAAQDVQTASQGVASAQREVDNAAKARDEAWNKYYQAWNEADAAHKEWAYLRDNYERLHREWEQRKDEADSLACGAPQDPGAEPNLPDEPNPSDYEGGESDPAYITAKSEYTVKKNAHDTWQRLYEQFLADTEAYKAYQDALAKVGEEPQPAGVEPEYPDAPEDTSLVSAIQAAQDGVTSASQAVQKAQEAYEEAVKVAEKRKVTAPAGGNIVALGAKVGEPVGAGSSSSDSYSGALVQISDVSKMGVGIEVNEIDILEVEKGQRATATFSAVDDAEVAAEVTEVATVATGGGDGGGIVTFHVGLTIPKPDSRLREGMTANVQIFTADVPDALIVPASALSEGANGMVVEVVVDEETMETELRQVKVGPRNSSEAVIEEGLQEGEVVLLMGGMGDYEDAGMMAASSEGMVG